MATSIDPSAHVDFSMPNWSAEFLLAALVVTSLATGGLLGLWAATSRWHWFARTMVVFGVLTPLLWRPIYEPFITLLVEVAVVVLGVTIYRRNWPTWRFSVRELLLLTVPLAIVVACIAAVPELRPQMWPAMIGLGAVAGMTTLVATLVVVEGVRLRRRMPAILAAVGLSMPMLCLGWCFVDYTDGIFDVCERCCEARYWGYINSPIYYHSVWKSALIHVVSLFLIVAVAVVFARVGLLLPAVIGQALTAVAVAAVVCWPLVVASELLHPLPIPQYPVDNAYEDLLSLSRRVGDHGSVELSELQRCLDRPIEVINEYTIAEWDVDQTERDSLTELAVVISKQAHVARVEQDYDSAIEIAGELFRLSRSLEGDGVERNIWMSAKIEHMAVATAFLMRDELSHEQQSCLTNIVVGFVAERPLLTRMLRNECVYQQRAMGWGGHLGHYLTNLGENEFYAPGIMVGFARRPERDERYRTACALSSLLATELALREYEADHGDLPGNLEALAKDYSPRIWIDAFSDNGEPLIYRRTQGGYLLYSRGYDGDDDGGRSPSLTYVWDPTGTTNWTGDGDLSLEAYFGEE